MKIYEFSERFPDEKTCREHFKNYRLQEGITCRKCGGQDHYYYKSISKFQCKNCRSRMSLRSGTVMQYSNLPFRTWYLVMAFMASGKKNFSALEIQRQTGHSRYEPIWYLMHKIRAAMGERDDKYKLKMCVEVDEGFFETGNPEKEQQEIQEQKKRGRGSQKQSKVLVMAESTPIGKEKKNRPIFKCGFFKMKVIEDLESSTINKVVKKSLTKSAIVISDGFKSYNHLKEVISGRISMKVEPKDAGKLMPWVHIAISNAKRNLLGAYHQQDQGYIQNYLNEFCYKLNRRYFGDRLFERLVIACVSFNWRLGY